MNKFFISSIEAFERLKKQIAEIDTMSSKEQKKSSWEKIKAAIPRIRVLKML